MKHMDAKILIVDDFSMNISLLKEILIPVGYTVDSAESGEEALD
ncbi:MAG: two-component system response regulator, partial [Desulfobacula sp.]|nr:two-component system response regulator [Desulfobacula sp.]